MKAIEILFQPTLPTRGATDGIPVRAHDLLISTHAPNTGSDLPTCVAVSSATPFQPTLPARGATCTPLHTSSATKFQPTLPARGATYPPHSTATAITDFNPRSPHGERQPSQGKGYLQLIFQPTLPARGATPGRDLGRAAR